MDYTIVVSSPGHLKGNTSGRKYIDSIVSYLDRVDISVHELDDMLLLKNWNLRVSPEMNRKKPCIREVGSSSRKLDLNHPVNYVVEQSHVIDMDEGHDHSKTYGNLVNHEVESGEPMESYHVDCNFQDVEEPSCHVDGRVYNVRVDEVQQFIEVMVSDDNRDAFYSKSGDGFDNSRYDFDDNISEFHSAVDVDEHGILNKHTKTAGNDIVDEELEVIDTDDYQFKGFHEDDRNRMLKELSRSTTCSHVEVYLKPFRVGLTFKTKAEVKNYKNSHVVKTMSNLRIPIKSLHKELCKKLELGMTIQKVVRAKTIVDRIVSRDYQVQYGHLRDYVLELQNTSPGTTVRIDVTTRTFRRIYIFSGALKLGFKSGLRDFLEVDGTFLKGLYLGQVLTVVGLD
uniref:Uncharacterized protein n=1 Tax=Lactuca sativa TaxID=4236 RepID=A0A9R1WKC0_LACSA|nr:hypothetical protein LSAT_V11C100006520 [Lactuca sativa]